MSFRCEHCGFQNNEIQSAGTIRRTSHPNPLREASVYSFSQRRVRFILLGYSIGKT